MGVIKHDLLAMVAETGLRVPHRICSESSGVGSCLDGEIAESSDHRSSTDNFADRSYSIPAPADASTPTAHPVVFGRR